ncbi:hypothetical protein [Saprospira grandis]|uniref:hypothetical protein n=1 Tax=Saprospira grandis TaxID=1008 RepID=UPI0022DE1110|nr:hypothetical protein [Saprospira grandis]WBM73356.1 hypothetical protein OP864_10140 [Saprospira grandis]
MRYLFLSLFFLLFLPLMAQKIDQFPTEDPKLLKLTAEASPLQSVRMGQSPVYCSEIDWEALIHAAASMLELERMELSDKKLLSSAALSIRLLSDFESSVCYHRPKTYAKYLKQWLSKEEQDDLDAELLRMLQWDKKTLLWHWEAYLQRFPSIQNFNHYGDSLLLWAKELPELDALDYEASIRAHWGLALYDTDYLEEAVHHFERCFEIRMQRKDPLYYVEWRLADVYDSLEEDAQLAQFYKRILEVGRSDLDRLQPVQLWRAMETLIQLEEPEPALAFYEEVYLPNADLPQLWEDASRSPYRWAMMESHSWAQAKPYAVRWYKNLKKYCPKPRWREASSYLLRTCRLYQGEADARDFMQTCFEELVFTHLESWGQDEFYFKWEHYLPYAYQLKYAPSQGDSLLVLDRWTEQALRTKDTATIQSMGLSLSGKYRNMGQWEKADQYFEDYYCRYLPPYLQNPADELLYDSYIPWYHQAPYYYALAQDQDYDRWASRWVQLADQYGFQKLRNWCRLSRAGLACRAGNFAQGLAYYEQNVNELAALGDTAAVIQQCYYWLGQSRASQDVLAIWKAASQSYALEWQYYKEDHSEHLEAAISTIIQQPYQRKIKRKLLRNMNKWRKQQKKAGEFGAAAHAKRLRQFIKKNWR